MLTADFRKPGHDRSRFPKSLDPGDPGTEKSQRRLSRVVIVELCVIVLSEVRGSGGPRHGRRIHPAKDWA